jgi:hypothetical protein
VTKAIDRVSSAAGDAVWLAEVERRARAAIAGEPGVPWDTAKAMIERRLRELDQVLAEGIAELDAGRGIPAEQVFAEVKVAIRNRSRPSRG